ncbi:MSMEG_0570 family nitrogen starvation response protein [Mycolicibacterium sp. 018/SC-01/001]|uniref:MSMEG_0570 family nitrogen starvation response protein n=1 Tax=Mycolicibacterium sp. 018/SC-01/001 TaxID=2592069 RepID=UPI00117DF24A|nr:MSMEG_0570 family nitrogen starvation response protein [Mycolicibacterium sp. 018/SC-01/001]TRW80247.1 MSMEG_0570 family nitrogen starvation response protein [Mycolicibacterium sp. 018/SC-01/001]
MPEMTFDIRWPDGSIQSCYSPSLVMHDFLTSGQRYTVGDLVDRAGAALEQASDRVRAKYGFACTSAAATNDQIMKSASRFAPDAEVTIIAMQPSLERS